VDPAACLEEDCVARDLPDENLTIDHGSPPRVRRSELGRPIEAVGGTQDSSNATPRHTEKRLQFLRLIAESALDLV
jgi:hypothetical protein